MSPTGKMGYAPKASFVVGSQIMPSCRGFDVAELSFAASIEHCILKISLGQRTFQDNFELWRSFAGKT
jgi:hypothetical protein